MKKETKYILGTKVDFGYSMSDVLGSIDEFVHSNNFNLICTTNAEFIMDAVKDTEFKEIINNSELSLPDGSGVIFAYNYKSKIEHLNKNFFYPVRAFLIGLNVGFSKFFSSDKYDGRITGVDMVYEICKHASKKNYSVILVGGWPKDKYGKKMSSNIDVAKIAAEKLKKMYPNLNISLATSQISYKDSTIELQSKFHDKKGDIILAAFGHKKQEKWLLDNASVFNAKIGVGVGGSFDYISSIVTRPSEKVRQNNIEWLYRLLTQPWRYKRIFKAFPLFPLKVYKESL